MIVSGELVLCHTAARAATSALLLAISNGGLNFALDLLAGRFLLLLFIEFTEVDALGEGRFKTWTNAIDLCGDSHFLSG